MTKQFVTDEQLGVLARREHELFRRVRDGSLPCEPVLDILQLMIERNFADAAVAILKQQEAIQVPDLEEAALVDLVKQTNGVGHLSSAYLNWKFLKEDRAKKFLAMTWQPGHPVSMAEVRAYFAGLRANGHVAAFLAWLIQHTPNGWYATIPDLQDCCQQGNKQLCPDFRRNGSYRGLGLSPVGGQWHGGWTFVAFREADQQGGGQ